MENYIPPYHISDAMLKKVSEITEKVSRLSGRKDLETKPHLRRNNRIMSIHSSLRIEAGLIKMTIPDKPNSRNQRYVRI